MTPSVSVVVPALIRNHDEAKWLIEAMRSVYAQDFTDYELIVVDDGSPIPLGATRTFNDWQLIRSNQTYGPGRARNIGASAATGEYLLFLDADDTLKPQALSRLWDARCKTGVIYGDVEYTGSEHGIHVMPEWSLHDLLLLTSPLPITALHSKDAWQAVSGFDESLAGLEDVDYWIRLADRGFCGQRISATIFSYRRHVNSRQSKLEENDKQGLRVVRELLKARHRRAFSDMANIVKQCSKCPGSGGSGTGVFPMAEGMSEDQSNVRYIGSMNGGFTAMGSNTRIAYYVDGKGATITVDTSDVPGFLSRYTNGRADFELLAAQPISKEYTSSPVRAAASLGNPSSDHPGITSMNAKDATSLIGQTEDLPDLLVWRAEEQASEKPRKSVLAALEAQIGSIAAGIGQDG